MSDYLNGIIYKLVCEITGETYIGSTRLSLEDRLNKHLTQNCCSRQILARGKYYIEQLELYPCNSRQELERREGEYQRVFECININIAGRTQAEYKQDNKEKVDEYRKQYQQDNKNKEKRKQYEQANKEKIKARKSNEVMCECGIKSTQNNLQRHKLTKKHKTLMSKLTQPCAVLGDEGTLVC